MNPGATPPGTTDPSIGITPSAAPPSPLADDFYAWLEHGEAKGWVVGFCHSHEAPELTADEDAIVEEADGDQDSICVPCLRVFGPESQPWADAPPDPFAPPTTIPVPTSTPTTIADGRTPSAQRPQM